MLSTQCAGLTFNNAGNWCRYSVVICGEREREREREID